jgi:probable F420-dependent oxidoreductase
MMTRARIMRFGVVVPNYRKLASPENLVLVAQRSEALGFDSLWVTDHVVIPEAHRELFGATIYDPLSVLAFVAAHTRRVDLGTAVLVLPYRHPVSVAKQLATIDNLSGGRVVFGIGAGWSREEFAALGANYAERGPVTDEYLRVILELWTNPEPVFEGSYVTLRDVSAEPRPLRQPHPPILVGGYGKKAIRRAVAMGEGWLPDGMTLPALQQAIGFMRETAERAGRDPATLTVALRTGLHLAGASSTMSADDHPTPWEQSASFTGAAERQPFHGTTEQVVDDIHEAEHIGVEHLIFECPVQFGDERFDTLEAFAADVMPQFRVRARAQLTT